MRKVVAFEFLSLDGVADGPDRFFTAWDDVVDEAGAALIATQGRGNPRSPQLRRVGRVLAE